MMHHAIIFARNSSFSGEVPFAARTFGQMQYFRHDRGTTGELERTPQGGLVVPAFLTRAGVFEYDQPDGRVIREWRPSSEVFHKDTLATLPNATLTNTHPSEHVNPANFKKHVVGHVETDSVKTSGDKIAARLVVQDGRTIRDLGVGRRREVSCGYHCDVDEKSGVVPEGEPDAGMPYDRVQRSIRYNHVALVDDGRAGPDVRLRLDSKGNQTDSGEETMKVEVIDGVDYEVGTPAHTDAVKRRSDAAEKQRKDAADTQRALAEAKKRADAAEERAKKAQVALVEATSAQRLDHAVAVRGAIIRSATAMFGREFKADGMSEQAIKIAAVRKLAPQLKLDGKGGDYVNGLFRMADLLLVRNRRKDAAQRSPNAQLHLDGGDRVRGGDLPDELRLPPPGFERRDAQGGGGRTLAQVRSDRDEEARHRRPLAVSKSNPHREMDGYPSLQGSMLETMK
jgi:hypothetical protein